MNQKRYPHVSRETCGYLLIYSDEIKDLDCLKKNEL